MQSVQEESVAAVIAGGAVVAVTGVGEDMVHLPVQRIAHTLSYNHFGAEEFTGQHSIILGTSGVSLETNDMDVTTRMVHFHQEFQHYFFQVYENNLILLLPLRNDSCYVLTLDITVEALLQAFPQNYQPVAFKLTLF